MSTAVAAGWSLQSEQLSPHQHHTAGLAQEGTRLSCLPGNTFEIKKKKIYEVLQKTAKTAKKNLEYLAAKKVSLIRCFNAAPLCNSKLMKERVKQ